MGTWDVAVLTFTPWYSWTTVNRNSFTCTLSSERWISHVVHDHETSTGTTGINPYTVYVRLLFRLYLPCCSWEGMGILKALFYSHLESQCVSWCGNGIGPASAAGSGWWNSQIPSCGRNRKAGGTVRCLHVCTRRTFWLGFLQKSSEKRPVASFEREERLLFSWKIKFFSLLSSSLPIKAETILCFAKLPVFLYFSGKINIVPFKF